MALGSQFDRGSQKAILLADAVFEVTHITEVHQLWVINEQYKSWWV